MAVKGPQNTGLPAEVWGWRGGPWRMGRRAPQSKEWPGGRDTLGGLTGPRGGSVAVAGKDSGD